MRSIQFKFPANASFEDVDAALRAQLGDRFSGLSMYSVDAPAVMWLADSASEKDVELANEVLAKPIPHIEAKVEVPLTLAAMSLDQAKAWVRDQVDGMAQIRQALSLIIDALYVQQANTSK